MTVGRLPVSSHPRPACSGACCPHGAAAVFLAAPKPWVLRHSWFPDRLKSNYPSSQLHIISKLLLGGMAFDTCFLVVLSWLDPHDPFRGGVVCIKTRIVKYSSLSVFTISHILYAEEIKPLEHIMSSQYSDAPGPRVEPPSPDVYRSTLTFRLRNICL